MGRAGVVGAIDQKPAYPEQSGPLGSSRMASASMRNITKPRKASIEVIRVDAGRRQPGVSRPPLTRCK